MFTILFISSAIFVQNYEISGLETKLDKLSLKNNHSKQSSDTKAMATTNCAVYSPA